MPMQWRRLARAGALAAALAAAGAAAPARADESGSGHYQPGFWSYFAGILPSQRGLYLSNYVNQYSGAAGAGKAFEIGGVARFGVQAYAMVEMPSLTYVTGKKIGGATLAMNLSPEVIYLDTTAAVAAGPALAVKQDTNFNLGDVYFAPAMLGWQHGNTHWLGVMGVYAPTGEWQKRQLSPTGKNFWTFEPGIGVTYLNPKSGWELSSFAAIDFNTTNNAIDYKSGDDFHVDFLVANHVIRAIITPQIQKALEDAKKLAEAVASGHLPPPPAPPAPNKQEEPKKPAAPPAPKIVLQDVGAGLGGYYYQQVTGDSGAGAFLGPFQGRAFALGPALEGTASFGKTPVTFQLRVLKEFGTENRLQGINTWFSALLKL
jgi:hypothetical protein